MQNEIKDKKAGQSVKDKKKYFPGFPTLTSIVISLIISLSCVAGYHHYFAPRIVTVDLKGYVQAQRDLFLANKIDQEGLRRNLDKMEEIITSIPKNNIVFSRDAVLRNAKVIELK
ncbi:MAG: hypothetical protein Q7J27_12705 [Syntrophales bacterium]|nr:hypothetical protein [Syntrophales bacterium]